MCSMDSAAFLSRRSITQPLWELGSHNTNLIWAELCFRCDITLFAQADTRD